MLTKLEKNDIIVVCIFKMVDDIYNIIQIMLLHLKNAYIFLLICGVFIPLSRINIRFGGVTHEKSC